MIYSQLKLPLNELEVSAANYNRLQRIRTVRYELEFKKCLKVKSTLESIISVYIFLILKKCRLFAAARSV